MSESMGEEKRLWAAPDAGSRPGSRSAVSRKFSHRPCLEVLEVRQLLAPLYPLTNTSPTAVTNVLVGQPISTSNLLTFTVDNPVPDDATEVPPNSPYPVLSQFTWGDPGTDSKNDPAQIVAGPSGWVTVQPWGYDNQVATGKWSINGTHTFTQPGNYLVQGTVTMAGNPDYDGEKILVYTQIHVSTVTPPTLTLSFNPASPTMGVPFTLAAMVTNNDPNTLTLPLNYSYSLEPRSVLPDQQVGTGSISPDLTLAPGHTVLTDVANFNYKWAWIPPVSPLAQAYNSFVDTEISTTTNALDDYIKTWAGKLGELASTSISFIEGLNSIYSAVLSALSTLNSSVPTQTLDVTATIPYDPQGNTVIAHAQTTIEVSAAKRAHLYAYIAEDSLAGELFSSAIGFALTGVGFPEALLFAGTGLDALLAALGQYQQAVDPPDPNYKMLPIATVLDDPQFDALEAQAPQYASYVNAVRSLSADEAAEASAFNKSQGAQQAGDSGWQAQQLAAAAGFEADAEAQLTLLAGLQPAIPALPSGIDSSLTQAGWSAAGVASLKQFVAQQTTDNASGISPVQANWQAALQASQTIESNDLANAVSAQTSGQNQSVTPVSANDAQTLSTELAAIKAALAIGDPTGKELPAIEAFQSKAINVALATNNLVAVQPDLDAAAQFLTLDQQQAIAAQPNGVPEPTPILPVANVTPTPVIPTVTTPGPTVSHVAVRTTRHQISAIVINFNEPIASGAAGSVATYGVHLLNRARRAKNGVYQTNVGSAVKIKSVIYNPSGPSVTLALSKPLRSNQGLQLRVNGGSGGVTDQAGIPLNSPASGSPGTSFVENLD